MNITLLCSNTNHPIYEYLETWVKENSRCHEISLLNKKDQLLGGDILFLISCSEIIGEAERKKFKSTLVIHASDLPKGRGWSPHIWDILNGADSITVTLLEAADKVDTGRIWKKLSIPIAKDLLWNEINDLLFKAEIELIDFAIENTKLVEPIVQDSTIPATYHRKRTQDDSKLDVDKTIREQFDLIRISDPSRYPAYFELHGTKYRLLVEKIYE